MCPLLHICADPVIDVSPVAGSKLRVSEVVHFQLNELEPADVRRRKTLYLKLAS
ncbi:hypothetical protein PC129_g1195 [Phytophthora cactorum]|uniref:Uncharacterized protein n=1 Tax=Phytophthora cactorum TaxID=29920 RepID=A0A8T1IVY3_9STRA|nr:hypothetical protein Pcac1_g20779 [Phytophthora cactorum]KAG2843559.1 hypothetical protein PC112_g2608 [Phytophthora cactorum]KAG2845023.1 hypothetical protein PC111_g1758 [Phytophthora cactorum]KAG2866766.1 hypothetical protein PC113_g2576 [Phytophthora cactorum]KAG2929542.1 hypothetical protein PC114_g2786 [Phytophthora cactorum]